MIIVNLKGGLGNQMFQYACGRALALRNAARGEGKAELVLDATGYDRPQGADTPRFYALDGFTIAARLATPEEALRLKYPFGAFSKAWRLFHMKILRKFYINFVPSVLTWHDGVYLDGFWQSEKYFKDFEKEIRADFTLKKPFSPAAKELHAKISHDPFAVALHVRRGDYVTDKVTNEHWGTCSPEYYTEAIGTIAKSMPKPNIYVFSDDMAWCRENITSRFPLSFVSSPNIPNHEEVTIMAACKHNIIANSSYGWWGAWLNQNPDKIVIAPEHWAQKHNSDWYADILPETWIRL